MRVGLALSGGLLTMTAAKFAAEIGATDLRASPAIFRGTPARRSWISGGRNSDEPIPDGVVWNMRLPRRAHLHASRARCPKRSSGIGSAILEPRKTNREDER
jgi:hypothetical protein